MSLNADYTEGGISLRALFSDGTENYCSPMEPEFNDKIRITMRTGKDNVEKVTVVVNFLRRYTMTKERSDEYFDYYVFNLDADTAILRYYFEIAKGEEICYYSKLGPTDYIVQSRYYFTVYPGFSTPDWVKGSIIYQIMVDRFNNGDKSNDVLNNEYTYLGMNSYKKDNWYEEPSQYANPEFYGGDLQGIIDKLDYLKDLGVQCLYLNPIFVSPSNHKYDIQDYEYVDPHLGKIINDSGELLKDVPPNNSKAERYIKRVTDIENLEASNQVLINLIEEAHKRDIKIILDGVFNHCGSFNKWMDESLIYEKEDEYEKGAFVSKDSEYRNFFKFNDSEAWPYNYSYDGWWGHKTLPKLNYEGSSKLYEKIMDIAAKWVSPPFNADGWRLDVAADLGYSSNFNHNFWKDFRNVVKSANPHAAIIAEHYGSPGDYLGNNEWDTVMNYDAFMEPVSWFLTGMEKHSDEYHQELLGNTDSFIDSMLYSMADFPAGSLMMAMNELSNHDHSRFLTRTNRKVGRVTDLGFEAAAYAINKSVFKIAVVMQMTWPGSPTIYYADEAGQVGFTDPDNRRTYPWGREDMELIDFHKKIIALRKRNRAFIDGSLKFIAKDYNVLAYARFCDDNKAIVVINNNDCATDINLPVWEAGIGSKERLKIVFTTDRSGFSEETTNLSVTDKGYIKLHMNEFSAAILLAEDL